MFKPEYAQRTDPAEEKFWQSEAVRACCAHADGEATDWDIKDGHYWAPIDGKWRQVPDDRVLHVSNPTGHAIKWLGFPDGTEAGRTFRCFIPAEGV